MLPKIHWSTPFELLAYKYNVIQIILEYFVNALRTLS